jgi:hypothetical protein
MDGWLWLLAQRAGVADFDHHATEVAHASSVTRERVHQSRVSPKCTYRMCHASLYFIFRKLRTMCSFILHVEVASVSLRRRSWERAKGGHRSCPCFYLTWRAVKNRNQRKES